MTRLSSKLFRYARIADDVEAARQRPNGFSQSSPRPEAGYQTACMIELRSRISSCARLAFSDPGLLLVEISERQARREVRVPQLVGGHLGRGDPQYSGGLARRTIPPPSR
jgi:hypothetical protein